MQSLKRLFAAASIVIATLVFAGESPAPATPEGTTIKGEVLEVLDTDSFTYLRLKTKDGEIWAATNRASVSKGAEITLEDVTVMKNFESKALKRTFPTIMFGSLPGAQRKSALPPGHASVPKDKDIGDVHVAKAKGANAKTVSEIVTNSAQLKDKPVLVRGKVVRYNRAILGKNWIHLRDGTGSSHDDTDDILVTTANEAKVGDVVTAKGVVRTDKDFGSGYAYKVMIENATLQR